MWTEASVESRRSGYTFDAEQNFSGETVMKCLLVSDLHYALKQYDWITNVSKDFDVVVIAGDHRYLIGC